MIILDICKFVLHLMLKETRLPYFRTIRHLILDFHPVYVHQCSVGHGLSL